MVTTINYIYPRNKLVSFRVIAERHVAELRRYYHVQTYDEGALPAVLPILTAVSRDPILVQPYFYPISVYEARIARKLGVKGETVNGLIGIDVADTDHMTKRAVELSQYAEAFIVPSEYARKSYMVSGIPRPTHVVRHGIDDKYFTTPRSKPHHFEHWWRYKEKGKLIFLQMWCIHSDYRKGYDLAQKIYAELRKERDDVRLILRYGSLIGLLDSPMEAGKKLKNDDCLASKFVVWLTEEQKMELYDLCDIYLLTSRGGAFEHIGLEAMVRGEITIGAAGGAWEEYMPKWLLIPSRKSDIILPNNPIHDGYGVEMLVDKAVDKLHEIADNITEYRAKVNEYVNTHVKPNFNWRKIGEDLKAVVERYAG